MSLPSAPGRRVAATPRFYVTPTQRISPSILLLAVVVAFGCIPPVLFALRHSRRARPSSSESSGGQPGLASADASSSESEDGDLSKVETIYLGDPNEAPVTTRPGGHPRSVHPFIVVQLPRSGDQVGQIPDTPAGHLLYNWLAVFNNKDPSVSGGALLSDETAVAAAQIELRKETGGLTLLSSKEIQPGVLVFRLHDQTPSANEVLGTLQVRPASNPASIASFSLRAIPAPRVDAKAHM